MKRILFTTRPILGHIIPALAIASRLQSLGFHVYFAAPPSFEALIRSRRIVFVRSDAEEMRLHTPSTFDSVFHEIRADFQDEQRSMLETIRLISQLQVRLVVTDASLAGPAYAAEKCGIEWVSLGTGAFLLDLSDSTDPENSAPIRRYMAHTLNRLRKQLELPPLVDQYRCRMSYLGLSPYLHLIFDLPQPSRDVLPESFNFIGPVTHLPQQPLDTECSRTFHIIATSLSYENPQFVNRSVQLLQTVADSFKDTKLNVGLYGTAELGKYIRLHTNTEWMNTENQRPIPFERACFVISHGGNGSYYGALEHGKPVIVFPIGFDAIKAARHCEQTGTGIRLRRLSRSSMLRAVAALVTKPDIRRNVLAMSRRINSAASADRGAAAIIALLQPH